jgi:hypothetical protein
VTMYTTVMMAESLEVLDYENRIEKTSKILIETDYRTSRMRSPCALSSMSVAKVTQCLWETA